MRFNLQTSLLALVFAIGTSDAFAAPTVRALGGTVTPTATGTVGTPTGATGSTGAGTSMRAGSLRTTGTYVGPRATVSTSGGEASDSVTESVAAPTGSAVSSGSGGLNRGSSTTSRLSVGKYIGAPGKATSTDGTDVDLSGKVDKFQGKDVAGEALIVGDDGWVTTGEMVSPEDFEQLEVDLSGKVDKKQGKGYTGNVLIVNDDGMVEPTGDKVDRNQGTSATGNVLVVNTDGYVEATGDKVDRNQGTDATGNVLVVNTDGYVEATGDKVDRNQGTGATGKALVVNTDGYVEATGEFLTAADVDLSGKVDKEQGEDYSGKVLIVNDDGMVEPTGDKVDRFQGTNVAGRALIVNDQGYVTTGRLNINSLGLKRLAFEDSVRNELVDDQTLEREKMAASITDTLNWIDSWREREPTADGERRYVMSVDEFGQASWFRVVTGE